MSFEIVNPKNLKITKFKIVNPKIKFLKKQKNGQKNKILTKKSTKNA